MIKKINNATFYLIAILMLIEAFAIVMLAGVNTNSYNIALSMRNITSDYQKTLIENTVKDQQELILSQIKQSLVGYIDKTNTSLVNNKEWNREEIENVLNIIAEPVKVFGNKGGIVVFDSITGDIFLDTTHNDRKGGNIKDDSASEESIKSLLEKKDTISTTGIIYALEEEGIDKPDDFKKYPLGKFNREFIEKTILPFESMGFAKDKQLTLLVVANEKDVFNKYIDDSDKVNKDIEAIEELSKKATVLTGIALIITMSSAIYLLYLYKKKE